MNSGLQFLGIQANRLMAGGQEIRLRGINLGNWMLLEDFMFGLPGTDTLIRRAFTRSLGDERSAIFWDTYEKNFITESDLQWIQASGFNFVRVPLSQARFEDGNKPGAYDQTALRRLDWLVDTCRRMGLYVMLDLHAVVGGAAPYSFGDSSSGEVQFWDSISVRARATALWRHLATRYHNNPAIAGYDLLNEPFATRGKAMLSEWYRETIRAIREVDTCHIISLEGDHFDHAYDGLAADLFEDPLVTTQIHTYPLFTTPYRDLTTYPGSWQGKLYDRAFLRKDLLRRITAGHDRPVMLGEFGLRFDDPKAEMQARMVADLVSIAEEENIHWCFWSYKDVGRMGWLSPKADTPWMQFLNQPQIRRIQEWLNALVAGNTARPGEGGPIKDYLEAILPVAEASHRHYLFLPIRRHIDNAAVQAMADCLKDFRNRDLEELADSFAFHNCRLTGPEVPYLLRTINQRQSSESAADSESPLPALAAV